MTAPNQFGMVFIEKVDGVELNPDAGELRKWSPGISAPRATEVHLRAGRHVIEVSWKSPFGSSISNVAISFVAEAAHVYEVWADNILPGTVLGKVAIAVVGGREGWTAWPTNRQSGALIGGHKPPADK